MSNIWSKLVTALRGGATEVGEAIVDNQALRILDQEIRDADEDLRRSKEALANIMAKHKLAEESVSKLKKKVVEYESYAMQALEKGDNALATEVAEKIATYEAQLASEEELVANFAKSVADLRRASAHAEGNIKRLKQQVDTVKATESVQKAQAAVAHRHSGSTAKMQTAMDSLERIKRRQAERSAQMEAAAELHTESTGDELDAKLRAAGIAPDSGSAQSVLDRLKAKKGG